VNRRTALLSEAPKAEAPAVGRKKSSREIPQPHSDFRPLIIDNHKQDCQSTMFAVPGWSVSSNNLKTQAVEKPKAGTNGALAATNDDAAEAKSKKRKRSGKSKGSEVNPANLADLWETVIEGKPKAKKEKSTKRQKTSLPEGNPVVSKVDGVAGESSIPPQDESEGGPVVEGQVPALQTEKKKKKKKSKREEIENIASEEKPAAETAAKAIPPVSKPATHLTPLQASMRQKLVSARFRHLNQTLYTTPSAHSLSLFQENPEMFTEYHEGFRRQVEVWPENPVNGYISQIEARGKVRGPQKKAGEKDTPSDMPLPRTDGTCNIADLGCGDAALSTTLQPRIKKLHLKIHSFDLQAPSPLITKADIANLPLADGSVDVAIFCLALMGTNWVSFIEEAFRILRWKGELWIAEIKSRFGRVGKSKVVAHSVGNRQRKPLDKKALKRQEEEADDAVAAVEVDGHENRNAETDVTAFVEVLRKRGFVLRGEGQGGATSAIDLSNKMFVKMHFVKGLTPIKGKCVPVPKGMEKMGLETWKKKPKGKFIDEETDDHVSSEASVLKPCVYKLR
jgi:ribosomal RNA-processing protein 8